MLWVGGGLGGGLIEVRGWVGGWVTYPSSFHCADGFAAGHRGESRYERIRAAHGEGGGGWVEGKRRKRRKRRKA